jgi:hypothetical protein
LGPAVPPTDRTQEPVFAIQRTVWRRHEGRWLSLPGADPVRSFHDRPTAEAAAREMEWDLRRRVNPFLCGAAALHYQTSFDAARLYDWCLDHGLDPPGVTADSAAWAAWWETHQEGFTPAQRAAVWEVLDRVRFFRVVEAEPAEPMHLVALPHFENDPVPSVGSPERYVGCTPDMLVRSVGTADSLCHELYVNRVVESGMYGVHGRTHVFWRRPEVEPFGTDEETIPYETHPTYFVEHRPLGLTTARPPTPGRDVFIVLRRGWRIEEGGQPGSWRWTMTHARTCGRPVAAFGTLAAADAHMAWLEAEARQYPSPFRFGNHLEWGTLDASRAWGVLSLMAPITFTNQWSDYLAADRQWNEWWDAAAPHLTADQMETVWSLFDNLRFYEVVAVEFRE